LGEGPTLQRRIAGTDYVRDDTANQSGPLNFGPFPKPQEYVELETCYLDTLEASGTSTLTQAVTGSAATSTAAAATTHASGGGAGSQGGAAGGRGAGGHAEFGGWMLLNWGRVSGLCKKMRGALSTNIHLSTL
jgi:hypothetical protein